ncbi:hypothetical protein H8E77_29810 [bacterium]|nr:hypothetical protein [bacterium]
MSGPTVVPELLVIPERETKWLWRPTRVGGRKRMAVIVPSTTDTVNPEEALRSVELQIVAAQINRHFSVAQVNRSRIYPTAIEQEWQY